MTSNYIVQSGIHKEQLKLLNQYLKQLELTNGNYQYLNKVLDEFQYPGILSDFGKVSKLKDGESFDDLAFIFNNEQIVGHFCHKISKDYTSFGSKISAVLKESFTVEEISQECEIYLAKEYIANRVKDSLLSQVYYEKEYQRQN